MRIKGKSPYGSGLVLLISIVSCFYIFFQAKTIYGGDAGDLASAIITSGIAHPPGYPLYTLLGIAVTKIIITGTYAWRIGFLSSIPAILTIAVTFDLIYYLTKKISIAFISSLILAFVYPFWLYAEVVEVFSLNNLFLVSLLWLLFHWAFEGKNKYLYLSGFIFGLSSSHHHIIVFLVPTLFYLFLVNRQKLKAKTILNCFIFFIFGLTPYLYILLASYFNNSLINWMGSPTVSNFIKLVIRARYGTFQSGGYTGHDPILRLLNDWAFFDFFARDFRLPGIILSVLGIYQFFKQQRTVLISLLLGIFFYLLFLFIASFPLIDNFLVATFERFILSLYILIIPLIAAGFLFCTKLLEKYMLRFANSRRQRLYSKFLIGVFFMYPLGLLLLNYPRISILRNDQSAENLGRDILISLPQNSILLLSTDTPLFDTQYVYYGERYRSDVKLIHLTQLFNSDDRINLKKNYKDLLLPDSNADTKDIFKYFLTANYQKFPIYSKLVMETTEGSWIPYGLVFRFVKKDDCLPTDESIIAENEKLWFAYHEPLSGSLSKYQNLMLSDIIPNYATAHQEIGFWAAKNKYSELAEKHLLLATKLAPEDLDSYIILAQVYLVDKKCQDAELQISRVEKRNSEDVRIYFLQSINYAVCFKDKEKALYYAKLYEEKKKEADIPLKHL